MKKWVFAVLVVASLAAYMLVEPYLLRVREYDFTDSDVPEPFAGKKIAFVSDIHCGQFFPPERVRGLVENVNELGADIILLGGDYVDSAGMFEGMFTGQCIRELNSLKAPLGVYGVLGNHEHWSGKDESVKALEEAGVTLIDNSGVWVRLDGDRIRVGGMADPESGWVDVNPALEGVSEDDLVVIVSHRPDFAEGLKTEKVDLFISGHTHGGQITLFGLWSPFIPSIYGEKYRSGLIETNRTKVIVSNGVGTTSLPIRFFAPPDIVLVTLERP